MNIKKNILYTILCLVFVCDIATAQLTNIPEKSYTYTEAKELLLTYQNEFTAKGKLEEIPLIGVQINEARTKRGISTQELAGLTGLSNPQIKKIENGKLYPTREVILKIEEYLDTEIILDAEGF